MVVLVPLVVLTAGIALGFAWPRWGTVALSVVAAFLYLAIAFAAQGGPDSSDWGDFGVVFNVVIPVLGVVGTGTGVGLARSVRNGTKVP